MAIIFAIMANIIEFVDYLINKTYSVYNAMILYSLLYMLWLVKEIRDEIKKDKLEER